MLEIEDLISTKRKFLFRCESCDAIVSAELEEEDIAKLVENLLDLACNCEGTMKVLRD